MVQQGQTIELTRRRPSGERLWAYRFRTGGRGSKRVQRGGFASEQGAREALERELIEAIAGAIGPRYGPMILFAAATGVRPAEWIALEERDVDREERAIYVRRSFTRRELKVPKTEASMRAVPLQTRALEALEQLRGDNGSPLLFPGERGSYLDIHHFRRFQWSPAQRAGGINPLRRVYDLRHTFATFALRAGISTFDLSRYMGASLTMIDRHYGHLARDGREHAIKLLDALDTPEFNACTSVDAAWTPKTPGRRQP